MSRGFNWRAAFGLRDAGVYYALILLVAVLAAVTAASGRPGYLNTVNLTNIVYQASLVGIMGVAMTVMLITGAFDLSVASVAALAGAVLIGLAGHIGFWPSVIVALLAAAAVGLVNGLIVELVGINAFIVTLGTLTAVRGLVLILTGGRSLMVQEPNAVAAMSAFEGGRAPMYWPLAVLGGMLLLAGLYQLLQRRSRREPAAGLDWGLLCGGAAVFVLPMLAGPGFRVPNPVVYLLVFTLVVWFTLAFTTVGRRVYAVGGNAEAARLAGVNVRAYKLGAFVLSGLAAGFAGVLFGSRFGAINPTALQGAELTVIAAAILGGTSLFGGAGSVIKTVAGALLLFTLTNGFNVLNLGANYQGVIEGTVLVIAAAIYTIGGQRRRKSPSVAATPAAAMQTGAEP